MTISPQSQLIARRLAVLCLLLVLTACATTTTEHSEDPVVERAKARWAALLGGDPETAYGYLTPGYRSKLSLADYLVWLRLRRVSWTTADYQDHQCEGDSCTVKFKVGFRVAKPVPGVNTFDGYEYSYEKWLKIDGDWWFLPEK